MGCAIVDFVYGKVRVRVCGYRLYGTLSVGFGVVLAGVHGWYEIVLGPELEARISFRAGEKAGGHRQ